MGGGSGQRWRGAGQIKRGIWKKKDRGSGQRLEGLWRALHVIWRRLQGGRRSNRAVVDVARLEEKGWDGGRGGWSGGCWAVGSGRAGPGQVVGAERGEGGVQGQ